MLIVAAVPALAQISQEKEQESESGDVNQSLEISGGGDNSNQCVRIQGVTNAGNAQNQIGVLQYGEGDGNDNERRDRDRNGGGCGDFEFDEVGSTITVSPETESSTACGQQVNQAATAIG